MENNEIFIVKDEIDICDNLQELVSQINEPLTSVININRKVVLVAISDDSTNSQKSTDNAYVLESYVIDKRNQPKAPIKTLACRTCLQYTYQLVPFSDTFYEDDNVLVEDILHKFDFIPNDSAKYPRKICIDCFAKLKLFYDFQKTCRNSEEFWRSSVKENSELSPTLNLETRSKNIPIEFVAVPEKKYKIVAESDLIDESNDEPLVVSHFETVEAGNQSSFVGEKNKEHANTTPNQTYDLHSAETEDDSVTVVTEQSIGSKNRVIILCLLCHEKFNLQTAFQRHIVLEHDWEAQIQMVPNEVHTNDIIGKHMNYYCKLCKKHFLCENEFRPHLNNHQTQTQNKCFYCNIVYFDLKSYYLHLQEHYASLIESS